MGKQSAKKTKYKVINVYSDKAKATSEDTT